METIVLILPKLTEKVNVEKIKLEIHKYVGDRLVKQEDSEMPGLILKGTLEEEDKKHIANIAQSCGFIFVEYDEENNDALDDNYLTFTL